MGVLRGNNQLTDFESSALPHLDEIYRTAAHMVENTADAQDLAQEVYLQAWRSFAKFQPGTNCRAWLFKILIHKLRHHRRKWFALKFTKEDPEALRDVPAEAPVPVELEDAAVLAALAHVPEEFREVLLLTDVNEFSYKEAASLLDVPIGTVMSRLSRGRKILRGCLAGYAREGGAPPDEQGRSNSA